MSDPNLYKNVSLYFLGITFSADTKWIEYIESVAKSTARKVGSLFCAR